MSYNLGEKLDENDSRRRGSLSFLETKLESASLNQPGAASHPDETTIRPGIETVDLKEDDEKSEGRDSE